MPRIDCFDNIKHNDVKTLQGQFNAMVPEDTDLTDQEQKEIGKAIAIEYYKKVNQQLIDLKNKIGIKSGAESEILPDRTKQIREIEDKYSILIKQELDNGKSNRTLSKGETQPERDTEIIISAAGVVVNEARKARTEKAVDASLNEIEDALNEIESKVGKLTESWSTDDIAHETPSKVIGKQVKKEITKYAKEIARINGWVIPDKGIYDNIAPAGGDVIFKLDIPGTPYQMYVNAKYEPEISSGGHYEDYAFNGFFYRLELPSEGRGKLGTLKHSSTGQWQRQNIAAKEMAQILRAEANKYINAEKPTISEIAAANKGRIIIGKIPFEFKPDQKEVDEYFDNSVKRYNEVDAKSKEALLKTVEGLVKSYEDNLKGLTADDYNEGVRGLSRQKMKVQLEAGRKFLDHVKENKSTERIEKVDNDIDAAWAKFTKGDKGTLTSGGLTKEKIEAGVELIGLYMKKGIYKFSDIIEDAKKRMGESLADYFDALKAVYSAYYHSQATEEELYQMDQNVENYTLNNTQDASTNTGAGTTDKSQVVPPVDGVVGGQSQGTLSGVDTGGKGTVGSEESSSSDSTTGRNGGRGISQEPSGGIGQGESDVAINGNDELNEELGGESVEHEVSQPKDQEPVVSPLQHNGNFVIPPDFSNSRSFNVAQKLQDNIDAIKTLIQIKAQGTKPTYEQQKILFKYVGWGGIKEIGFDPNSSGGWVASNVGLRPKIQEVLDVIREFDEENYDKNIAAIKGSVLNAHYTAIPVIRGIWNVLRKGGFKGGKILEPSAGVGHFIGAMPIDMLEKSNIGAIELDNLTSQILKGLYPNHIVKNNGYEEINIGENSVDLVISNIPFGNYAIHDKNFLQSKNPTLKKATKKVHSYFFARAIQDVKPNGVVAFVTTTGVLDSKDNRELREMMAEQAEFLGAIRLPNDAFKGNANTQVTTDIIFLRKFADTEKAEQKHEFINAKTANVKHKSKDQNFNVNYNEYFHNNPEMILGEVEAGSMYGVSADGITDAMTVTPTGINIEEGITKLADKIFAKKIVATDNGNEIKEAAQAFVANKGQRVGNLVEISDGVYGIYTGQFATNPVLEAKARFLGLNSEDIRNDNLTSEDYETLEKNGLSTQDFKIMAVLPVRIAKKYAQAVKDLIPLREALNTLYAAEFGDMGTDFIESKRKFLNDAYNKFKKNNGTLLENKNLLDLDTDGYNIGALEKVENKKVSGLADIFSQRIFRPKQRAETAESISDAIIINLNETGSIDIERVAELLKITPEEAIEQGKGLMFKNPLGGFETKDKYLSGEVRKKLEEAKIAAIEDKFYEQNVKALEAVQPVDLNASQIYAPISASWINMKYISEFASHIFKQDVVVNKLSTGRANVNASQKNTQVKEVYGTTRMDGLQLFEEVVQNRMPIVKDTYKDGDTTRTVVNEVETQKAVEKAEKIRQDFDNWIWQDDTRRNELVDFYNQHFNNVVVRKYDGSHLKFDGYAGEHTPAQHQLDGAWMVMQQMGGILDHIVGSGKTLLMVLGANKMKEMGLIKKPIIIGLKANTADIARTYKNSFPLAKVLSPTEKDFTPENRKAFFAKMANNDWDAIVMTHDQFGMIEQSREIQAEIIEEEIEALEADILNAKGNNMSKRDLNGLEVRKQNLKVKLQSLTLMAKDETLKSFEDMDIDFMFVDESQMFKNLAYNTIQRGVSGLGNPLGSNKAFNMLIAMRTLQRRYGADKGTVFASGTPISNTMVEMYLLFKYLRPNKMAQMGINSFDQWANTFARVGSEIEFGVTNSLKPKVRMRDFMNVPEMSAMYREIADVRNDSNLVIEKPKFKKTIRVKTDHNIPAFETVTIGKNKFKVIGRIKGIEKNEYWVSLKTIGADVKLEPTGQMDYGGTKINYSEVEYSDGLLINVAPTIEQRKFAKRIQKFAETKDGSWIGRNLSDKEKKAYMLLATNLASKMAIDMRLVDPSFESSEEGKIAIAADTIVEHYKESDALKGIQLVFSDLGTPKTANTGENLFNLIESRGVDRETMETIFGAGAYADKPRYPQLRQLKERIQTILEYTGAEFEDAVIEANEDNFNVYQELKDKLVKRGIPTEQIAFIHDYKSDKQKKGLFDDAKSGRVRVIIGSTSKLGTGVNVQDKIVAMHHLDVPWRPSDMEQRNGRGIRRGNFIIRDHYDNELPIYMYATESTLDAYKYQLLGTKQQFIDQAKTGDGLSREISEGEGDEENGISFAAMTAMLSGNPVILEKAKIDKKVKELETSKKAFDQDKYSLKDKIARHLRDVAESEENLIQYKKDKKVFDDNTLRNEKTGEFIFKAVVGGEEFEEGKEKPKTEAEKQEDDLYKKLSKEFKEPEIGSKYIFKNGATAEIVGVSEDAGWWKFTVDGKKKISQLTTKELKEEVTGPKKERTIRQQASDKLQKEVDAYVKEYFEKYPETKNLLYAKREKAPLMQRVIGKLHGFDIAVRMVPQMNSWTEDITGNKAVLRPEIGLVSPVSNLMYRFTTDTDISGLSREVRNLDLSIDYAERNIKNETKEAKEKQQYLDSLPQEFPKQKLYEETIAQQIKIDARLKEMTTSAKMPSMEELEQLGERIYGTPSEFELENTYALTEDNVVLRINDKQELDDAVRQNSRFYIYKEQQLPENNNNETDDVDFQFANISSEEIAEMQEVVKEQIDLGNTRLTDIQDLVARELDDDTPEMRQLVEEAYHEYSRGEDTPAEVVRGVIGRIEATLSAINGNGVEILPNTQALKDKADELGNVEYQNTVRNFVAAAITSIALSTSTPTVSPNVKNTVTELVQKYYGVNNESAPQEVIDRAIKLWERFGKPDIFGDSTNKNERAFADYKFIGENRFGIKLANITDFDDFIAELAHAAQFNSKAKLPTDLEYNSQEEYDKIEYERVGSLEYDAHQLIEPMIASYILNGKSKDFFLTDDKLKEAEGAIKKYGLNDIFYQVTMPNGSKKTVKPVAVDVVNGFYSPLEKTISEFKGDKLPAKQWADKFKGEEAKWTGLTDWLNSQTGSVSKSDIQKFLKENRIEIVEVVKGANESGIKSNAEKLEDIRNKLRTMGYGMSRDMAGDWYVQNKEGEDIMDDDEYQALPEEVKELAIMHYEISEESRGDEAGDTQYSGYQLPGEKSNYKEVLITMPLNKKNPFDPAKVKITKRQYSATQGQFDIEYDGKPQIGGYDLFRKENPQDYDSPSTKYTDAEIIDIAKRNFESGDKYNKLENQQGNFISNHWSEPNILAHVRMNTRLDAEGKKVLFIEELQSDWGEIGRKKGFVLPKEDFIFEEKKVEIKKTPQTTIVSYDGKIVGRFDKENPTFKKSDAELIEMLKKDLTNQYDTYTQYKGEVPAAPFVTDTNAWTKLAFKVALKEAVKQGADKIAWTTGEQQAERYDLSKHINLASLMSNKDGTYNLVLEDKKGDEIPEYSRSGKTLTPKQLEDTVGKDVAAKLIEGADKNADKEWVYKNHFNPAFFTLDNTDLKVGGEGMTGFYGNPSKNNLGIVGNVAKALFKQEPKTVEIVTLPGLVEHNPSQSTSTQHSVDITPEMRAQVQAGQPLFQYSPEGKVLGFTHGGKIYLNGKHLNPNTPIHEAGHIWTNWAEQNAPEIYNRGYELVAGSAYLDKVKANPFYQQQAAKLPVSEREKFYRHEALAHAIGDKGAQFVTEARKNSIAAWLKSLWDAIKNALGFENITAAQLQNLTFEEFTSRAAADILKERQKKEEQAEPEELDEEEQEQKDWEERDEIGDYKMTTSGEVGQMLSGKTITETLGYAPEGNQDYEKQKLVDMLQDGKNMIGAAMGKWGSNLADYGQPLFNYIKNMSTDEALMGKKAVLMATFLGEIREEINRNPDRSDELRPLDASVTAFYQNYMNQRGKEVAAGRLLRIYRDKYMGDIFMHQILEEQEIRNLANLRKLQAEQMDMEARVQAGIEEFKRVTQEEKDIADAEAAEKNNDAKIKQKNKKNMAPTDAQKTAAAMAEKIKKNGRLDSIVDKIKNAINKCK